MRLFILAIILLSSCGEYHRDYPIHRIIYCGPYGICRVALTNESHIYAHNPKIGEYPTRIERE